MRQIDCYDCGAPLTVVGAVTGTCPNCGDVFLDMRTAQERDEAAMLDAMIELTESAGKCWRLLRDLVAER